MDSSDQICLAVLQTLRNVALCISRELVCEMFGNAEYSKPIQVSCASLIDALNTDRKPVVSTLATGGVVSLREAPVKLDDESLEFFGVVPDMPKIAQAPDNASCGKDTAVGDAAFLKACGDHEGCAAALKKGEIAMFAVRVRPKTVTVDSK